MAVFVAAPVIGGARSLPGLADSVCVVVAEAGRGPLAMISACVPIS